MGNASPQVTELRIRHPVLGIEKHEAMGTAWRHGVDRLSEGRVPDVDPIHASLKRRKVTLLQVGRQRTSTSGDAPTSSTSGNRR